VPHPVFDTQVAAMVLGHGDSVSYEQIAQRLTGAAIDKSSRFTDWSRRPLSAAQLAYAAADVTHLRGVYRVLAGQLEKRGRTDWVAEEMAVLTSPDTYRQDPEHAWRRIKLRLKKPKELAVLMEVAAWRDREAQTRDVPRSRVLKDDAVAEIAQRAPTTVEALSHLRAVPNGFERSRMGTDILAAVERGLQRDPATVPPIEHDRPGANGGATVELLKVLLKMVAEHEGVASRVLATTDDLDRIAADDHADVAALHGWRRELFGDKALKLKHGELALAIRKGKVAALEAPAGSR
jgi:ribonuclease D